ncbi:MAG: hypothetical protein IKD66_07600 [Solobacterium sp.]|nr:hypothetical protein [Solobacterium sp.]
MPNFSDQNTKATNAAKPNAENKEKKDVLHTILDAFAPKAGKPKEEAKPAAAPAQSVKPAAAPAQSVKPAAAPAQSVKPAASPAQFAQKPAAKPAGMPSNIPTQQKPAPKPAGMPSNIPAQQKPAAAAAPKAGLKANDVVAKEVIRGDWGNGAERKAKLEAAGYNYDAVQSEVNRQLSGKPAAPAGNLDDVARRVIRGDFGNGAERKAKLEAAGYDYNAVQARVNQLLK